MANATIRDSTATNPGGTGSTITVTLPTHAAGDIILIAVGNTGNTLWTGNPAGWNRIQQLQVGTAANGLLGTYFYRRVLSGDSLPLTNPAFTLGATVTREAFAWSVDGASEEGVFSLPAWAARNYNTGTTNPIRPASITTPFPEALIIHFYFQRSATNAPDPSDYTQDEEIIISGTLVGNASSKNVADQATVLASQDASPTSGVRWVAGIIAIPSADYPYYRSASQATATATSVTPALPAGTTDTDVLGNKDVLIATVEGAGSTTLSAPAGWTEISTWDTTTSGGGSSVSKFWAYADAALSRTFSRTGSAEISAAICTYYNCHQSDPVGNVNLRQNASSTTSTWDALTRSATRVIVVATCVADGVPTFTAPSGWTERNDGLGITTADQVFNTTGDAASASFTLSSASPTATGLVEVIGTESVTEHSRSVVVNTIGAVTSSAAFFSVFERSGLLNGSASISVSGVRQVSRAVNVGVSGDIASAGTASSPVTTFERSASVGCTSVVESSATGFSVLSDSASIDATATVESSGQFFSILSSSLSFDAAGEISSTALFFSVFQGAAAALNADSAVESSGEIQPPTGAHERSVLIAISGEIQSSGFTTLERFSQLEGAGVVAAAAEFFSIAQSASDFNINGEIQSAGQCEILRGSALDAASSISVSGGLFFSILQSSGLIAGLVTVESDGLISTGEHEGSVSLSAASAILASGIAVSVVHFAPRQSIVIGSTSRSLSVGTEARTQTTESEAQTGTI